MSDLLSPRYEQPPTHRGRGAVGGWGATGGVIIFALQLPLGVE